MKAKKKVIKRENSGQNKAAVKRKSYLQFSWPFMALIFALGVAMFATIELNLTDVVSFHPLGLISLVTTFVAGCSAVKNGFKVRQVWVIGALCFFAIFWIVPYNAYVSLSAMPITANYLLINLIGYTFANLIANLSIYALAALIGGAISSRVG
ncbi:hypothetical protein A3K73_09415 [Candidatus Pacearchaeota archaeon RBG_13_36_9]|nr:MAG: hypothetical protein A3K73_09415 [Candidatus Pacearchaeota archaeon RBG_13_36_9]